MFVFKGIVSTWIQHSRRNSGTCAHVFTVVTQQRFVILLQIVVRLPNRRQLPLHSLHVRCSISVNSMLPRLASPPPPLHVDNHLCSCPAPYPSGFVLDPGQEACVSLDPETPAILLTAGAGTGKTHTLAARLARLLGVNTQAPPAPTGNMEPEQKTNKMKSPVLGARETVAGPLDDPAAVPWLHSVEEGSVMVGRGRQASTVGGYPGFHAAPPESVWVLSFTNQV